MSNNRAVVKTHPPRRKLGPRIEQFCRDKAKKLSDLRPHLLDEIKEFFVSYNKLRDRKFRATHDASPDKARKLIEEGMNTFKKKRRKAA